MLNKLPFFILLLVMACSGSPALDQFDNAAWMKDTGGCNNTRAALVQVLLDNKISLEGLGQNEIKDMLGTPDRHELYGRNKKAFVYFISPGPDCSTKTDLKQRLIIRFDGLGRAKEIIYYN